MQVNEVKKAADVLVDDKKETKGGFENLVF
jgi:hypothetical protein